MLRDNYSGTIQLECSATHVLSLKRQAIKLIGSQTILAPTPDKATGVYFGLTVDVQHSQCYMQACFVWGGDWLLQQVPV